MVVPAHDEESVIGRLLEGLLDGSLDDVVVVANGCRDRTADIARDAGSSVTVVELAEGSKIAALNAGDDAARAFPIAFVDADVIVSGRTLAALAERLDDSGSLVASPRLEVAPSGSWWVRQYYRIWALTDYRSTGHVGSGIYMISARGRDRFDRFPDVIADDLFIQRLFAPDERLTPEDLVFRVEAPGTLRSLLHRNTRIAAGNRELAERFPDLAAPAGGAGARSIARRVWRRPSLWVAFATYAVMYLSAHRRAAALLRGREQIAWNRDETTRERTA
ncbi:glycosyltransferase family 2 protein [Microbacterium allomyrinae]|uniref:4,4'-diaponeurosporenoate glycosyltransferase n=1 Tax=Microbacterium allomyrinae TaxID=2830666 RepID=A0A9X1LXQ9_9MICO|nr:glycosyltransferase [Microbacterium allomyrinae]MCC2034030.1 glycosyltransferase [Microbacterium allomyrinae]